MNKPVYLISNDLIARFDEIKSVERSAKDERVLLIRPGYNGSMATEVEFDNAEKRDQAFDLIVHFIRNEGRAIIVRTRE